MKRFKINWKNVATIVACFTAFTFFACEKSGDSEPEVKPDPKAQPVELKSPIRENTTLKDLGLEVDYFYAGNNQLIVENNAVLTIEPGVTIRFSNTGKRGGMIIKANATIKP